MRKPQTKVWLFLAVTMLAQFIIGYLLGGRMGLFIALMLNIALVLLIFFRSDSPILDFLHARSIEGQDAWGLLPFLQKHSTQLSMTPPDLYVFSHPTPSVLSVGRAWNNSAIGISTGLIKRLSHAEIEALMVHQICHLHRLNTFGYTVSQVLAHALMGAAQTLDELIPRQHKPFSRLLAPLAHLILKPSVRDKVFFENDDMAISILNDRRVLAEAMWKLDSMARAEPLTILPCSSHFFMVNPSGHQQKNRFLLTHPKIDIRIKRLIGYWPI